MSAVLDQTQAESVLESEHYIGQEKLNAWRKQLEDISASVNTVGFSTHQRVPVLCELRDIAFHLENYIHIDKDKYSSIILLLTDIAVTLCDWPLVISIQERLAGHAHDLSEFLNKPLLVPECYFKLGRLETAKRTIERKLIANPNDSQLNTSWNIVNEYEQQLPHAIRDWGENEISLTPLQHCHLQDFYWQYTSSIMELCNLPEFTHDKDWFSWFDDMNQDPSRRIFAVIHKDWGFIGCVSLQIFDGIGFFYYWLGEDFQGCGLGPKAVDQLLDYGQQYLSMTCCYAKVYEHNTPSHKAIRRIGFKPLSFKAFAPSEDEVFYYLGAEKTIDILFYELRYLLQSMNSVIELLPNQHVLTIPE